MKSYVAGLWAAAAMVIGVLAVHADPIAIPNGDFLSPDANSGFYARPDIAVWQKATTPGWWVYGDGAWDQTTGVFYNIDPTLIDPTLENTFIDNLVSAQAAFLFAQPEVELFQVIGAKFEVGNSYQLTFGMLSSTPATPFTGAVKLGTEFDAVLYYLDDLNNRVAVGTKTVVNSSSIANRTHLTEFVLDIPVVDVNDAWAEKNIGVQFISRSSDETNSGGVWDLGNVQLSFTAGAVPEPASLAILGVGALALLRRRRM